MTARTTLLRLSDDDLAAEYSWDFHKTTGNGGQKKNKTSSAVRVFHQPTGLSAVCDRERSQKMNRKGALHKLRIIIALTQREPFVPDRIPELCGSAAALTSPRYPAFAAGLLDAIAECGWEPEAACTLLDWSKSHLFKIIGRDPALGAVINREREKRSKSFLHFCS